jgi:hypothetical protein
MIPQEALKKLNFLLSHGREIEKSRFYSFNFGARKQ